MIEWFASKIGMFIFLTIIVSLLLTFFIIQSSVFEKERDIRNAQNIVRLIDTISATKNLQTEYEINGKYNLKICIEDKGGYIEFNGIKRYFISAFNNKECFTKNNGNLILKNNGGSLEVS
ncbi:MAG: hypothetical protein QXO19_03275 [Candidatus Aenigmatarchaeota archaeon]